MKKFNLSLVAVLAMSTFAIAGGDIAPVEPVVETPYVEESTGAFYLGLGYGAANLDMAHTYATDDSWSDDFDYDTVMFQAGYNFNPYVAVEVRYWMGLDEDVLGDGTLNVDTFGIYVKPQYPVSEAFNIYALLGYADNTAEFSFADGDVYKPDSTDGFSWGLGAAYSFNDNVSLFVDYVEMYNDDNNVIDPIDGNYNEDITLSSWNFGVTYSF